MATNNLMCDGVKYKNIVANKWSVVSYVKIMKHIAKLGSRYGLIHYKNLHSDIYPVIKCGRDCRIHVEDNVQWW